MTLGQRLGITIPEIINLQDKILTVLREKVGGQINDIVHMEDQLLVLNGESRTFALYDGEGYPLGKSLYDLYMLVTRLRTNRTSPSNHFNIIYYEGAIQFLKSDFKDIEEFSKITDHPEVIVSAALKLTYQEDGVPKELIVSSVRHHACWFDQRVIALKEKDIPYGATEGFLTNKIIHGLEGTEKSYRFVDRREAMIIHQASGQYRRHHKTQLKNVLFSEDLY